MEHTSSKSLPENAYTELAAGEIYQPIIPASAQVPETSFRAILWGVIMCVIFTVASAYSGLKVGQVMEASIPISILAIGLARIYKRRSTLLENVILTGIGGTSGSVVAGAIFTIPALYILQLNPHPMQSVFICLAGGLLGVLFIIPLRQYFVKEMHGKFAYPEATAITEVLVTGEKGGSQAKLLLQATFIAGIYDFFLTTFQVWKSNIDFLFVPFMKTLSDKAKMVFNFEAETFILGMGYVMGLRSSMILCAGGVLANFALVPLIWMIGQHFPDSAVYPGTKPIAEMSAAMIFRSYVRMIGVGAIATAGIFGIIKSLKIIFGSFSIAAKTFKGGHHKNAERTDRDIHLMINLAICLVVCLAIAFFFGGLSVTPTVLILGLLLVVGFSFFFATVAANAIATTARNPVSGMTMLTIIVSSAVLLQFGLSGTTGMFFVMAIAGMLCTAVSMSGQFITDLKTGYWLGSTPVKQQYVKILGVTVAAIASGLSIVMLAKVFQFGEALPGDLRPVLASPQAAIMKTLVHGFMSNQPIAYILFGVGIMVSIVLEMLGVSPLVFALGMYLPLELNTPCLVGGYIAHLVTKKSNKIGGHAGSVMRERGVIIASGLMAGGALGGVFGAALRLFPWYKEELITTPWFNNDMWSQLVSIALFTLACLYIWFSSNNKKAIAKMN